MQIGRVSEQTGLSIDAIRFYEKQGLLEKHKIWIRSIAVIVAVAGIGLAAGAVQLFPSVEYSRHAVRWFGPHAPLPAMQKIPYAYVRDGVAPQGVLMLLLFNAFNGNVGTGEVFNPYLGVFPLLLAIIGVWKSWHNLWVRYLTGLAAAAFFFSLGSFSFLHGLAYALVPLLWMAREAGRFLYLTDFALAILAAFGAETLFSTAGKSGSWDGLSRILKWVAIGCCIILCVPAFIGQLHLEPSLAFSILLILISCALFFYITHGHAGRDADRVHLVLLPGSRGLSKLQQQFSKPLLALVVLVAVVLLIACANVANLLLARATTRQKEIALRLAIGASRGRIIRQLLTESIVLVFAGGVLGISMAFGSIRLLVQVLPATRSLVPQVDWRMLTFCFATSIIAGILFGLAPAFETAGSELTSAIKNMAARSDCSRWLGVRDTLLTGQVALCVVLLIGASLFVGTLRNLRSADSGFHSDHVLQLSINPCQTGFTADRMRSFYDRLLELVRTLPGVRTASMIDSGFMSGGNQNEDLYPPGYQPRPNEDVFSAFNVVAPGFFETLGIARVRGREFDTRDNASASNVVIVNEPYARHFFGNQNPIGRRIGVAGKPEMEIVGVVRATKFKTMRDESPRIVYMPFAQMGFGQATLYVQTGVAPLSLVATIRKIVGDLDRDAVVYDIKTLQEQIDESMAQERLIAWLSSFFGLFALALAATGLYGVISYKVSRRTREIGVRMALGAQRTQILGSVLRESLLVTVSGIAFGTLGALITARFIAALLYGLAPQDPVAFGISVAIMLATANLAAYVPANRACRVDPMVALRYE